MIDKNSCPAPAQAIYSVQAEQAGLRLDAALAAVFPGYGLRARRRLWEWCRVCVDGIDRKPAFKVRAGQEIAVIPHKNNKDAEMPEQKNNKASGASPGDNLEATLDSLGDENLSDEYPAQLAALLQDAESLLAVNAEGLPDPDAMPELEDLSLAREAYNQKLREYLRDYRPAIVAADENFVAFSKPEGIASAALSGGGSASVEELIARHWPEIWAAYAPDKALPPRPTLCNRLDSGTSGLLLAAFTPEAGDLFREYERQGKARKKYLALVHGSAPEHLLLNKALDTYRRKTTLVLPHVDRDFTRHSKAILLRAFDSPQPAQPALAEPGLIEPGQEPLNIEPVEAAGLLYLAGLTGALSLLEVTIQRGARHQIRAHLAEAGYPIVGDLAYGLESTSRAGRMFLHHFEIALPGFKARWMPDWDLPIDEVALE